ncbi:H-NS histone family protein [Paraburkholderia sp. BCC1885]|uniref:H-NS histone family protein n=1 Tax=Paraburkholderia sp. BCC1885 TaxID=2562669 RepID=UPI0011828F16|nr:H-NS histone family protein [Paraburkholderia sp. BCC1885]
MNDRLGEDRMATYQELLATKAELERRIMQARELEIAQVIDAIHQQMAEYGITINDIQDDNQRRIGKRRRRPAKYRDPQTGSTWSGRGRPPLWFDRQKEEMFVIR